MGVRKKVDWRIGKHVEDYLTVLLDWIEKSNFQTKATKLSALDLSSNFNVA